MHLLITIDTEGDNAWAGRGYENGTENARYLPRFQRLCGRFGFMPTYLTTYEMGRDDFFVEFARDALARGECEIGAHPHPWNQPPECPVTSDDMRLQPYLIEYPPEVIAEKLRVLTALLSERFDVEMRSHRAGRWAFDATYARLLASMGYTVDCSVTPHYRSVVDRREEPSRVPLPDYRRFPTGPYFLDATDISRPGDLPLLEIPMTLMPLYGRPTTALYWALPGRRVKRLMRGVLGQPAVFFRPNGRNRADLLRLARRKLEQRAGYVMLMLHSSEFMAGCNPTFKNERDIEGLYADLEVLFDWLRQHGVEAATCSQYRDIVAGTM
ncbi:MAG: deacetylase [Proteobacteria bacterium]|nr:deacetylase [Pseudomonadota bacterium]